MERKSIAKEIMALRSMALGELAQKYREVFGKEPASGSRESLWKEIARRIEADRNGESTIADLERLAGDVTFTLRKAKGTKAPRVHHRKPDDLPPGTILVRRWRGREIRLQATEGGYEVEGGVYGTLSAAAKVITGSHWNGRLFWGLKTRRKP